MKDEHRLEVVGEAATTTSLLRGGSSQDDDQEHEDNEEENELSNSVNEPLTPGGFNGPQINGTGLNKAANGIPTTDNSSSDRRVQKYVQISPTNDTQIGSNGTSHTNRGKFNNGQSRRGFNKMTKAVTTDSDGKSWKMVPPDGGWGWLVLAGSMLVNILIPGTIKSFGVLFVEFLEAFEATPAQAAWIPALCYFLYSSLGPLSSILSVKYSFRTVTILGGVFAAAGMMLTFWASSIEYLYISYGVMVGIGAGLSFPPTVYIVTSYFVRLRGLANGLCISGSALGSIILPPVLRYLLETFGYRGAVLIMGGVTLNVLIAAIFYEPVEKHLKRVLVSSTESPEDDLGIVLELDNENSEKPTNRPKFAITSGNETPTVGTPKMNPKSPEFYRIYQENGFVRSASAVVVRNYSRGSNMDDYSRSRKISAPSKNEAQQFQDMSSTPSLYVVQEGKSSDARLSRFHPTRMTTSGRLTKRSPSTSSFQYISTPYHGSTLSALQPTEFASHLSLKSITNAFHGKKGKDEKDGGRYDDDVLEEEDEDDKKKNKYFDLSLLCDPTYLVILISNSTNAISYTNFIILLPAYAISLGFDKSLAAYLLSIVSTLDLVGRIGGSALSDTEIIPKTWYFIGGLAISGFSLAVLPFTKGYLMISICCSFFGLASGVYVGITAVIMADMLGTERLTSSYGISLFVNGLLQLIGPPLCGVWFEAVNSHAPLFTTLGIVLLVGASLWGFMPFINRAKLRQEMAMQAEAESGIVKSAEVEKQSNLA